MNLIPMPSLMGREVGAASTPGHSATQNPARNLLPSRRAWLLTLFILVFILSSAAYFLLGQYETLGSTYFVIDDVWIHLQFARNLADGHGFSFNPGEPIAASTAPLWTVILAISYKLTGELFLSAYFWGIAFFAITCFLVYRLVLQITNSFPLAVASSMLTALCPWLTWSALSGMEISLSAALVLATILLHLEYQDDRGWKGYLSPVAAGLATLSRPETYVLFLAIVIHRGARSLLSARGRSRRALFVWLPVAGLVFALVVLPYGLFSLKTSGSFFPNTYSAKVGDLGLIGAIKSGSAQAIKPALLTNPRLYLRDFVPVLLIISPVLLLALPFGILGLLRKDLYLLPLFFIMFPLVVGTIIPTDRISYPWYRHMLNLIPVIVIVSLAGSHFFLERTLSWASRWGVPIRRSLLGTLVIAAGIFFLAAQPRIREEFVSRGAAIKTEHIAMAHWINQYLPQQAVLAASDIGIVGFYTQRHIIDTEGLITPNILGARRRNSPAKDQEVYQYLQETQPDYLVKFRTVYPCLSAEEFIPIHSSGDLVLYQTPWTGD